MIIIILEIWKYGQVIEDMKIILEENNNGVRSYVTSTYYFKRLMTQLTSDNKEEDSQTCFCNYHFYISTWGIITQV